MTELSALYSRLVKAIKEEDSMLVRKVLDVISCEYRAEIALQLYWRATYKQEFCEIGENLFFLLLDAFEAARIHNEYCEYESATKKMDEAEKIAREYDYDHGLPWQMVDDIYKAASKVIFGVRMCYCGHTAYV